jgi:guanylate kinase
MPKENSTLRMNNGIVSFLVDIAGVQKPRVIKRVSDLRRQIMLFGRCDDPAALSDLRQQKTDLLIRMPRPVTYCYPTDRPCQIVVVVGPNHILSDESIAAQHAATPQNIIPVLAPRFVLTLETMNELHVISGLPGSGRRNLVTNTLRRLELMAGPNQMAIIKIATTRRPRCLTDTIYYDFMSPGKFAAKLDAGKMIQVVTYGAVSYGIERRIAQEVLQQGDGICILVESNINDLKKLGYPVLVTDVGLPPNIDLSELLPGGDSYIN